jgi:hypothetical protein
MASPCLVAGGARATVVASTAALRLSAAALRALACGPRGLFGVTLANAAPAAALLAACRLTSSVRSMKAWHSASNGPETAVGRGRQKRSCANSAKTRSAYMSACPLLMRRRKPNRERPASSVDVWVRLPALIRATAAACCGDRGDGSFVWHIRRTRHSSRCGGTLVCGLCLLVAEGAGCVVYQIPKTRFLDVAWGTFEPGTYDFAVVSEVDELGLWFG